MKKFLLSICSLLILVNCSQNLDEKRLTDNDLKELINDELWLEENLKFQETFSEGINVARYQIEQQEEIQQNLFKFFETDEDTFSADDFWAIIDPIKEDAGVYAAYYQGKLESFSLESQSQSSFAQKHYKKMYELLFNLSEFLWENSRLTLNLIQQIEEDNYELYDYYNGKGLIAQGTFNSLLADFHRNSSAILNKDALRLIPVEFEITSLRLRSEFMRLNGMYLIGELTTSDVTDTFNSGKSLYLKTVNAKNTEAAKTQITDFKSSLISFAEENPEIDEQIDLIERFANSTLIYIDSINTVSETMLKGMEFFYDNRNRLDEEITATEEFDFIANIQASADEINAEVANNYNMLTREMTLKVTPVIAKIWK